MLKVLVIVCLNAASILAANITLHETPATYYVEWEIQNYLDLPREIDHNLNSTTFSFANSKWHLKIFPNGETKHSSGSYIGVYLSTEDPGEKYRVNYTLGLKTLTGSELVSLQTEHTFDEVHSFWGWPKFYARSNVLSYPSYYPKRTLVVTCRAQIMNRTEVMTQFASSSGKCTESLSDNLMALYTSKRFTDVTITCKNKEFSAHKIILSYRLPAFGSMLEKNPNKIEIPDCDPESFEEFLLFIYTGKLIDMLPKKATSLYLTADKFNMHELKEECVRYIAEHVLNIESFYDIRRFAVLQSDSMLLMSTAEFFATNSTLILSADKWENDPLQVNKLFLAYVEKNTCGEEKN